MSSAVKNIAPLIIEETIKSIPIVSQCFLIGDSRKYCSALITLDVGAILRDIVGIDSSEIPKDPILQLKMLNENKINQMIRSVEEIIKFDDPVDKVLNRWKRPNGLKIKKVSIPIGVIGVIYESRPNVTSDVSSLCFKSGNSVILRGGSEACLLYTSDAADE